MKQQRILTSRKSLNSRNHNLLRRIGLLGISVLASILILFGLLISFSQTFADDSGIELSQIVSTPIPTAVPNSNQFMSMSVSTLSGGGGSSTEYTTPTIEFDGFVITTTAVFSVVTSADDAGYGPSVSTCADDDPGILDRNEIYLGHCDNGSEIISGLRFNSVEIPDDANITSAFFEFGYVDGYSNVISPTFIFGEVTPNSPIFSTGNLPNQRLNQITTSNTEWETSGSWTFTTIESTPSIVNIIEEIRSIPGWTSGNPITFILRPNIVRQAQNNIHRRIRAFDFHTTDSQGNIVIEKGTYSPHLVLVYTQTRKASALQSTLMVEPQTAIADNNDFLTATITLSDTNGILVGKEVTLSATPGPISVTWPNESVTDSNGQVIAHIRSDQAQVSTLSATIVEDKVTLAQTRTITFTDVAISNLYASNDSPAEVNEPINFSSDVSTGTNVVYSWDFGDGAADNEQNPAHAYNAAGMYTAVVTASNSTNFMTATTAVTVTNPPADLSLSKTGAANAVAGSSTIYDISVGNLGSLPANNVIVTDTLPISTTFVAQNSPYNDYEVDANNGTIVWNVGVLQSGVTETFQLEVDIDPAVTGPITNTIVGSSGGEDGDLENNQAEWGLTVSPPPPNADLAVQLSGPGSIPVGFPIEYLLTIQNVGGQMATGIVVTDTLPVDITFSGSTHPSYNTFIQSNDVIFAIGSLASGQSYQITLTGTVASDADLGSITNFITGTADVDENSGNSIAWKDTGIIAAAPKITVLPPNNGASPAVYAVAQNGSAPTYVITLTNNGTADLVGGFNIVGKDYSWLSINPSVNNNDLGIGASATISIEVTDTSQDIGIYRDLLIVEDANGTQLAPIFLQTYIHPDLVNIDTSVTNTLSNPVPGAVVTLQKEPDGRVFWVDGVKQETPTLIYNQTTNGSGLTTFTGLEVGTYQYTISAPGHESVSDTITFNSSTTFNPPALTALPGLVFDPDQATFSVVAGGSAHYTVQVRNEGPGHAENFTITTPANLSWISSGLPYDVTRLDAGEAMSVTLYMNPPTTETLATYQRYISIGADNVDTGYLAATIHVLDANAGSLEFSVSNAIGAPIPDASILVVNESGRVVNSPSGQTVVYDSQSATTDSNGSATISELQPAQYSYHINAPGYLPKSGSVNTSAGSVAAGQSNNYVATQLETDLFTYNWTVDDIVINDVYSVTVDITYEAEVLEPVLFVSPAKFCPGQSVPFIVANVGPVAMNNVVITPVQSGVSFTSDGAPTVEITTLEPGDAYIGIWNTFGIPGSAAQSGQFMVTATYANGSQSTIYTTSSSTSKTCGVQLDNLWQWSFDSGSNTVSASYGGSKPAFPGTQQGTTTPITPSGNEVAQLTLSGEATLERQAFNARLELLATGVQTSDIVDVTIDIQAEDEDGQIVTNGFAITPTLPTVLGDLTSQNPLLVGEWVIVPGNLGITDTEGAIYQVSAFITYEVDGVTDTVETLPVAITVLPQPFVTLGMSHTQPDENGDFYVQVAARNDGYGVANNLTVDLSNVTTLPDLDGDQISLLFQLKETRVNGQVRPLDYIFNFGDIAPGEVMTGTWRIGVSASNGATLVHPVVTGFNVSCKHLPYLGLELNPLINCVEVPSVYLGPFCNSFMCGSEWHALIQSYINTYNGNFSHVQNALQMPSGGNELNFQWLYNSLSSGANPNVEAYSSELGDGWTHNYDIHLNVEESGDVTIQTGGTEVQFNQVRDTYEPAVGVNANLERTELSPDVYEYRATTHDQKEFVFNNDGQLVQQLDAQGNVLDLTYDAQGQLDLVQDPATNRFLDFAYSNGQLQSVTDPASRSVVFGYNPQGQLTSVTEPNDQVWTYGYETLAGGESVLSTVTDPEERLMVHTQFDDFGRAISQTYRGEQAQVAYKEDGRRLITDGLDRTATHVYNSQGVLVATKDALGGEETFVLDQNLNRVATVDKLERTMSAERTQFGYSPVITDVMDQVDTYIFDDRNNMLGMTDALERSSSYGYDDFNNLITETNALSQTTTYAYDNEWGLLSSQTGINGQTTEYGYDALGQLEIITDSTGLTTTYGYDLIGRRITTTNTTSASSGQGLGQVTVNKYDDADNLIQQTSHYLAGFPQNYLDRYNRVTYYEYDKVGNQTVITDTFGQVNLSLYDDFGRVVTRVVNYDGVTAIASLCTDFSNPDPEYNICSLMEYNEIGQVVATVNALGQRNVTEYDELGRVKRTVTNWDDGVFDPNEPDRDIIAQKAYDAVGNTIILTDTMGNMTRHFYDDLNRGIGSVTNWTGTTINSIDDFPTCYSLAENRDTDLCTMREYDKVGNTIIMTDAAGRMTRTFYDELDRVKATVNNWNPATLSSPADCVIDPDNMSEENVCSLTGYDAFGRHITTTNALGRTSLTVYDAESRPFIQVQNWDGTPINDIGDCSFPPVEPDVNLCTVTFFDEEGRSYASQDAMGNRRETGYDELGRVVTSTQWLDDGTPVISLTGYDARGNAYQHTDAENNTTTTTYDVLNRVKTTVSAEGVTITRTYNALGQVITTTNNLDYTTVKEYDGLGRVVKSWDGEQNLTQTIYDALGNRVGIIDANGKRTTYLYDQLQRQIGLIQNDTGGSQTVDSNVLTSYQYDVMGNLQVVTSALSISDTVTLYDSLNRPYYTENALGDGVTTQYDALGYRRVMTDGNEAVTTFGYDGLGRLETTSYLDDGETITATYNAAGEHTSVSNGLGTITYEYDTLGRLLVITDTQDARVAYGYDKVGNRTQLTYPAGQVVTYTYNMDNQLDTVTAWDGGLTDYDYDTIGRLVTMTLPTGITSVGAYDGANRVTGLTHRSDGGLLLGQYNYELDGVGQPQVVTETLASPTLMTVTEKFLESSGLLVIEAEDGAATAGEGQDWQIQTNRAGFTGDGYVRVLPDLGAVWEADSTAANPALAFPVQVNTSGDYAAWVRGMAADASGDSLHLTLDGAEADSAARLTGFVPDSWTWSRLTMSNTNATLSFPGAGEYDVQLLMREDGLRVDKLLLITDTNYIPTGSGPTASAVELITDTVAGSLGTHVITYNYDDLYRLTEAQFSGALSGTYQYEYNAVGSRMAYTSTITSTVVTTYTYDAANQLATARSADTGVIWHYVYDGNGQRVRQVPGGLTPAAGEVRYTFNQAGEMVRIENHDGSDYVVQADVGYDGLGNRVLGTTLVEGVPVTVTYTLDGFSGMPLMIANPVETTLILYGQYGIGEYRVIAPAGEQWHYYLGDGQLSVRQLTDEAGDVTLTRTYAPYGSVLAQAGTGSALFGYAGGQSGTSGLWYFGNGYFDPQTGQFLATTGENPFAPLAANVLANPGSLLFGPLMLISWRRRKKKRIDTTTLLFFGVMLAVALTSCNKEEGGGSVGDSPELGEQGGTPNPIYPGGGAASPGTDGGGNSVEIPIVPCPTPGEPADSNPTTDSNPTVDSPPTVTPIPTIKPTPSPTPASTVTILFGGSWGQERIREPGPDPAVQTKVWDGKADFNVPYTGSKNTHAAMVDVKQYENTNLILIGYSSGADSALLFAIEYYKNKEEGQGTETPPTGNILGIALLGATVTDPDGVLQDNVNVNGIEVPAWENGLDNLLAQGTKVYIIEDSSTINITAYETKCRNNSQSCWYDDSQPTRLHITSTDNPASADYNPDPSFLHQGTNNNVELRDSVWAWLNS